MTLVELLVAITVMIIILAGVAAGATSGLGLARTNSDRIIAANIADEQISNVRAMEFADIPQSTVSNTVTRGAVTYTWTREAEMVFLGTVQSCETPSSGVNANRLSYLRVIVEVTWPNMAGVEPVRSETIIDPPVADYDPYEGHLAVQITDRDGEAVSGVTVHLENANGSTPSTSTFETTDAEGCAVFDSLGVAPGTTVGSYYVWVDEPGYVDRASGLSDTSEQDPQPVVNVVSGQMRKVEFAYDRAAYLDVDLVGEYEVNPGTPLAANLPVTIYNDNYNNGNGPVTFPSTTALRAQPLHPFTAGFAVWAGCGDADPGTENRTRLASLPHTTTSATVPMATAKITVTQQGSGNVVDNAQIVARDACNNTYTAPVRTDGAGRATIAMPYGEWTLAVVAQNPQAQNWPKVTLSPRPDGTTVHLRVRGQGGNNGNNGNNRNDDDDD